MRRADGRHIETNKELCPASPQSKLSFILSVLLFAARTTTKFGMSSLIVRWYTSLNRYAYVRSTSLRSTSLQLVCVRSTSLRIRKKGQ